MSSLLLIRRANEEQSQADGSQDGLVLNLDRYFDESDDDTNPNRRNVFSDSDEDAPNSNKRNIFSDDEEDPFLLANIPAITKKKEKGKSKTKTAKRATKQPDIFNDILSNVNTNERTASKADDMAFSGDEGDDNSSSYSRTLKKRAYPLNSESSEDEQENTITAFDKQGRLKQTKPKVKSTKSEPLKRFSPFLQFNKKMRAKIAQENGKDEASGLKLSQLVAEAWRNMSDEDKHKFNEELAKEKLSLIGTAARKKPRPTGNGYITYSKENMPALKLQYPDVKQIRNLSSIMSSNWKALSKSERQVYMDRAKKEKDDWIRDNPEEHQQYLDKMASKIRATKKARREEKEREQNINHK
ncbi:hypothetical protein [Parasitella parasitica]|uniref:HMG box domain-containing protein n=1 Tax=Parasitella parasitica TaxID=35722 RepID=A0A0B7NVD5_9FUNG|nr:hypothetical protein [Parasitella parasitica]